jgi:hypothetical protein
MNINNNLNNIAHTNSIIREKSTGKNIIHVTSSSPDKRINNNNINNIIINNNNLRNKSS